VALKRPALGGFWLGTGVGIGFLSKGLLAPGVLGITAALLPLYPAWRTAATCYVWRSPHSPARPGS